MRLRSIRRVILHANSSSESPLVTIDVSRWGDGYYPIDEAFDVLMSITTMIDDDLVVLPKGVPSPDEDINLCGVVLRWSSDKSGVTIALTSTSWFGTQKTAFTNVMLTLAELHGWEVVDERATGQVV